MVQRHPEAQHLGTMYQYTLLIAVARTPSSKASNQLAWYTPLVQPRGIETAVRFDLQHEYAMYQKLDTQADEQIDNLILRRPSILSAAKITNVSRMLLLCSSFQRDLPRHAINT